MDCLEKEKDNRNEEINKEREELENRNRKHEKAFNEIIEWISKLKENKTSEEENTRIDKLETERSQDRAILIYAIKKIHQVTEVKSILDSRKFYKPKSKSRFYKYFVKFFKNKFSIQKSIK